MKVAAALAGIGLAVVLGVSAAGLPASRDQAVPAGSVTIVLEELRFVPRRLDAQVGVPLTVRITNPGLKRHDLNFTSLHMPGLQGVQSILEPGETRTITLTMDQPGTHTFTCTLPGHAAAGMTGALFVRP
jgi:uncharacterized cupredoxin-like copper-binding protein